MKSEKEKAIKCLKNNKSPGIDMYRMNKEGGTVVTEIYNSLSQSLYYKSIHIGYTRPVIIIPITYYTYYSDTLIHTYNISVLGTYNSINYFKYMITIIVGFFAILFYFYFYFCI